MILYIRPEEDYQPQNLRSTRPIDRATAFALAGRDIGTLCNLPDRG
jgi:hypothetical protein